MSVLKTMIKDSHYNAVKNGFYDCVDCDKGRIQEHDKRGLREYKCNQCNGTGKTAKLAVYKKILEENEEFLKSEPSETFNKDSEQAEISDMIITLLAYSEEMGYDIENDIVQKIEYNKTRDYNNEAMVKEEKEIAKQDGQLDIF